MSRVDVDYQYYADVFKGDALTESDFKKTRHAGGGHCEPDDIRSYP